MKYLFMCLLLTSCIKSQEEYKQEDREAAQRHLMHLVYLQDKSTHTCFAFFDPNYHWGTMTSIPCTEEILKKAVRN